MSRLTLDIRGKKTKFSIHIPYLDRSGEVSRVTFKKQLIFYFEIQRKYIISISNGCERSTVYDDM